MERFAMFICHKVLGKELIVRFSGHDRTVELIFHVPKLGEGWFSTTPARCRGKP